MELKKLSDDQIEAGLQKLLPSERKTLHLILLHIREVDSRRIYLRRARGSLFEYLTKDCGYSASAAQRRLEAARLSQEIPEVLTKVQEGSLNLFQIAILQRGVRQQTLEVPTAKKKEVLATLEKTPFQETEQVVAKALGLTAIKRTFVASQSDDSTRLSVTLHPDTWQKLTLCRDSLSHRVPSGDYARILDVVLSYYAEKQKLFLRTTATESVAGPRQIFGPLTPRLRRQIIARDRHCQFFDTKTKRTCGSTTRLQVDHITMRAHGGTNDPNNLRVLCALHNRQLAEDQLGK